MKKKTIIWGNEEIEVDAIVLGPIMVHQHPEMPTWRVSHTATGRETGLKLLPSKDAAIAAAGLVLIEDVMVHILDAETVEDLRERGAGWTEDGRRNREVFQGKIYEITQKIETAFASEYEAIIPPTPTMETLIEQIELDADELEHISNDPETDWIMDRTCTMIEEASDRDKAELLDAISQLDGVVYNHGYAYAEPGYDDPKGGYIFMGDWNKHDNLVKMIEAAGGAIEWSDEWYSCGDCCKLVRTQADSYSWQASFVIMNECEVICHECMEDDDTKMDYIKAELEGNSHKADTLDWDLEGLGYVKMDEDFQNGLYGGQKDSPHAISKALEARDITRYLFQIDRVGQFDCRFSCWVHDSEITDGEVTVLEYGEAHGSIDPAVAMKNALQSASEQMSQMKDDGGVKLATCHEDGTATVKSVSKEDFIAGNIR